jgi:hypothetical protein
MDELCATGRLLKWSMPLKPLGNGIFLAAERRRNTNLLNKALLNPQPEKNCKINKLNEQFKTAKSQYWKLPGKGMASLVT